LIGELIPVVKEMSGGARVGDEVSDVEMAEDAALGEVG
jgi:hypothetical protein